MKKLSSTYYEILRSRDDLSDYAFHFTKKANAKETLRTILEQRKIRDIGNKGFICFTEAPVTMLHNMFEIFNRYTDPMYAPYGIGIKKDRLFNLGARHAIYGTLQEKDSFCSIGHGWRFIEHTPGYYDVSWMREWRLPLLKLDLTSENFLVVASTNKDEMELCLDFKDVEIDAEPDDGGCTTY